MNDQNWKSTHIDAIERGGNRWIPIRKHFDIRSFGVNAWTAQEEGGDVIGEHVEDSGHEELYVVSAGHATLSIDGAEVDAPTGTLVYVKPEASRKAVAREAGTTVLSIGAKPGEAFEVRGWEVTAEMWPLYEAGEYERAAALLQGALEQDPSDQGLLYNLACMEALAGRPEDAIEHLSEALTGAPERYLEMARADSDLASIRDDPRVAELLSPRS
jgi:tetratricopeptide (TPR) repeat protein